MPKYRLNVGLDYGPSRRAEAGAVVSDLPSKSVKWLLEQGLIEKADGTPEPVSEEDGE